MKRSYLFKLEKLNTGVDGAMRLCSSEIVDQESADKLNWIFHNYAGQINDFRIWLDEYRTEKVPLSHINFSCTLMAPMEVSILRKHGLDRTGVFGPMDLLEDFESLMGEILLDEENGKFYLEGEDEEEEWDDFEDENHLQIPRPDKGKGSIII